MMLKFVYTISFAHLCVGIPTNSSLKLTVYHVNPPTAGAVPIDQDTGDIPGDLYFYLGDFLLPLECANKTAAAIAGFDCGNVERTGDLVVTKVDMEIDKNVSGYMACNLCNGTDPFTGKRCKNGTYICDCQVHDQPNACDVTKVGVQDIYQTYAPIPSSLGCAARMERICGANHSSQTACPKCLQQHWQELQQYGCNGRDAFFFCPGPFGFCDKNAPAWECWRENIPRKTRGYWVSTLKEGMCTASSPPGSCSWRVERTTTVDEKCLRNSIMSTVEASAPGCFTGCGPRNETSSCWIDCFFDAILGREARTSNLLPLGGVALDDLQKAWEKAFAPTWEGGCPVISMADTVTSVQRNIVV